MAIRNLHVSVLPDFLPCRTEQREKIQNSIREAIVERNLTRALYISGMPGTGKTATVVASIRALILEARRNEIPEFQFVEINCLRLHTPSDAYTVLWRHLSGEKKTHYSCIFSNPTLPVKTRLYQMSIDPLFHPQTCFLITHPRYFFP